MARLPGVILIVICYFFVQGSITFELDKEMVPDDDERKALEELVDNIKVSEGYLTLCPRY